MVRKKDPFWEYAEDLKNGRFLCKFCKVDFPGGISRIKAHLSGIRGRDIKICPHVPKAILLSVREAINTPIKKAKCVQASNNVPEGENVSFPSSSFVPNVGKEKDKWIVDKQLAKFFVSENISYRAIESPFFNEFVKGIVEYGPNYELPSSIMLRSKLVPDVEKEVGEYVENVIKYSVKTGCTLALQQIYHSNIITGYILAYTPRGWACLNSIGKLENLQEALSSTIESVGPKHIVQFINDSFWPVDSTEIHSTKKKLSEKYRWICVTPCAADGIEMLLREIYWDSPAKEPIRIVELIFSITHKHNVNLSLRRMHTGTNDLVYSDYFMLKSLLEDEEQLQALQISTIAKQSLKLLDHETEAEKCSRFAKIIYYLIHCKQFWNRLNSIAQVLLPLSQTLCLVTSEGSTSGYLYEMMERVKDSIEKCRDNDRAFSDRVLEILNRRRSDIMHPIHAAAAFLNPAYICSQNFEKNDEMKNGVYYILKHMVVEEEKEAFMREFQQYRMKVSKLFTDEAMTMLKTSHPRIWWDYCGDHMPVLQKYAIRILSQPSSSASPDKIFQVLSNPFDDHDPKFKVNSTMMERFKLLETQILEPIILDKLVEVSDDLDYPFFGSYDLDAFINDDFEDILGDFDDVDMNDPTCPWLDTS